ncbi:hypothetical protein [Ancylobacter terrae]|uniref:hypothetical protein n=1 Tax=Ancylobacter sp. sgz301288 TaxID=3342077 RepID=UPI00385D99E8
MHKLISAITTAALLVGCVDAATLQKANQSWEEAERKGSALMNPQLTEDCKAQIAKVGAKEQLAPLASNVKITQFSMDLFALHHPFEPMASAFIISAPFNYTAWGTPKVGRYGCMYINRGDHLEFVRVMTPNSFTRYR